MTIFVFLKYVLGFSVTNELERSKEEAEGLLRPKSTR